MEATLHFIAANRHQLLSPIRWELLALPGDVPSKPLSPPGKANKPSRSPQRIPCSAKAQSTANSVVGDRDRKGKSKARDVQEYHGEDGQENGWDHARVDEYDWEDEGEDEQEVIFPFTFRPPVEKPVEYAHLGPPSQYFSFTHITQTGEDAHDTRVFINPEDIHRVSCVEGDRGADAPVEEATPAVPAAKPTPREIAPLPKRVRARATRAPKTSSRKPNPPRTRTNRKYTQIREGVYECSVCHLEMSKTAKNKHAAACGAPGVYAICELCGRKSLNHRADSMRRHQRTEVCWDQRLAYAVTSVPRWSPTPRVAAWERGSLASNTSYKFGGRGSGIGGDDYNNDEWIYSDSSDEEDGLDGKALGYYGVDVGVNGELEDEDDGEDEGAVGDGDGDADRDEQEHEDLRPINDEGVWSEGEAWGGDAGGEELENDRIAGPS